MSDVLKAPKLTIICRTGTGCDMIDLKTCRSRGVVVTNVPGQNAPVSLPHGLYRSRNRSHVDEVVVGSGRIGLDFDARRLTTSEGG